MRDERRLTRLILEEAEAVSAGRKKPASPLVFEGWDVRTVSKRVREIDQNGDGLIRASVWWHSELPEPECFGPSEVLGITSIGRGELERIRATTGVRGAVRWFGRLAWVVLGAALVKLWDVGWKVLEKWLGL